VTCASLEIIAGWALGELPEAEAEAFERHYFGCSSCFARAERLLALEESLRRALPPVLTAARSRTLEADRAALAQVHVQPGGKALIQLGDATPVGVWYLHCDLAGVSRVDLESRSLVGEKLFGFDDVPFDVERGLVAMPCHLHYRSFGMDSQFQTRLTSVEAAGRRMLAEYTLDHHFL
jgi:hypothetical protein